MKGDTVQVVFHWTMGARDLPRFVQRFSLEYLHFSPHPPSRQEIVRYTRHRARRLPAGSLRFGPAAWSGPASLFLPLSGHRTEDARYGRKSLSGDTVPVNPFCGPCAAWSGANSISIKSACGRKLVPLLKSLRQLAGCTARNEEETEAPAGQAPVDYVKAATVQPGAAPLCLRRAGSGKIPAGSSEGRRPW